MMRLVIGFASMPYSGYVHESLVIHDGIDHAMISDANSPQVL